MRELMIALRFYPQFRIGVMHGSLLNQRSRTATSFLLAAKFMRIWFTNFYHHIESSRFPIGGWVWSRSPGGQGVDVKSAGTTHPSAQKANTFTNGGHCCIRPIGTTDLHCGGSSHALVLPLSAALDLRN